MRPFLLVALVHLLLVPAATADIWQWTDPTGVIRYTPDPERVPSDSRGTLVKVTPGMPPTATRAPAEEPPLLGPPDEFGADPFNAPQRARSVDVTEIPEPAWQVDAGPPAAAAAATAGTVTEARAPEAAPPLPEAATGTPEPPSRSPEVAPPTPVGAAGASAATVATAAPTASPPPPPVSSAADETPPATPASAATSPASETRPPAATTHADAGADATTAGAAAATTVAAASAPRVAPWSAVANVGGVAPPPTAPAPGPLTAEQVSRRDELEELIARDEEILKELLSDTSLDAAGFEENPELREIALRLPALQAELRTLKEGWVPEAIEAP